jgi:hypothetical protein
VVVTAEAAAAAFKGSPRVGIRRLRKDMDAAVDQDLAPRG